jgi:hypothetical protein
MTTGRGVCYIAIGDNAEREAEQSIQGLQRYNDLEHTVNTLTDGTGPVQRSRYLKTTLYDWSPYEQTLYLDADTRVRGSVMGLFAMLDDGWDMVIAPSVNQGARLLAHVRAEERDLTYDELGYRPVQLQGGVLAFRRNERVATLFEVWHREWLRFRDMDQAALLRSLRQVPVRVYLVGQPFNNGAVINHHFGQARTS